MKKIISISLVFFLCFSCLFAQTTETIKVKWDEAADFMARSAYRFPAFIPARVYFKNGDISGGKFNYDYLNDLMKYIDPKGDTLVIANESDINYITTGIDTFYYDNKYYERIESSANARLAFRSTLKLIRKEKLGAFGTSSPAANIESHEAILGISKYQLNANEVMVFSKVTSYYISSANGNFTPVTKKSLNKIFPNKKIEEMITVNKFDLNKEEDLRAIFMYANQF